MFDEIKKSGGKVRRDNKTMSKIWKSAAMILAIAAVAGYATYSYFSDKETSTGNTFIAGSLDLIFQSDDGLGHFADVNGAALFSGVNVFNGDLKPGDKGEKTVKLWVDNNPACGNVSINLTEDQDNSCTDPELIDDPTCAASANGELNDAVNFAIWADPNCNNVLDTNESMLTSGTLTENKVYGIGELPISQASAQCYGIAYCYGNFNQDGTCDGSLVNNASQTDSFKADLIINALQKRNQFPGDCPVGDIEQEQGSKVGALLSSYVAPTTCNVTVDDNGVNAALDTIQEGIDAATAGQTVCVKAGTYTQDVNVNKSLTLVGDGSTLTSLTGVGTGYGGALTVASGIDNVTIEGFTVNGTGESAVYLTSNNDNIDVIFNRIVAATAKNAILTGGQQTNSTLSNNVFEGSGSQLVYVNGSASLGVSNASSNVDFTNNTFGGTATGPLLGIEANGSSVTLNKFTGTTSYTSLETFEGNNLVNQNNFDVVNQMDVSYGAIGQNTGTLDATNNWWGDLAPANNVTGSGVVNFTPFASSAFPEN